MKQKGDQRNMSTKAEHAAELHQRGCNCAQAVACTFCKEFGILEQHFGDCKWRYSVFPVQLYCQHRNWNAGQYERIY